MGVRVAQHFWCFGSDLDDQGNAVHLLATDALQSFQSHTSNSVGTVYYLASSFNFKCRSSSDHCTRT